MIKPENENIKKLYDSISIHLDEINSYDKKFKKSNEYIEKLNELIEEYYDLTGEYYKVYDGFERVWGVQPFDERYIRKQGVYKKVFKTKNTLFNQLYLGARKNDLELNIPENIICMEQILVPTGNVEVYNDKDYSEYRKNINREKGEDRYED